MCWQSCALILNLDWLTCIMPTLGFSTKVIFAAEKLETAQVKQMVNQRWALRLSNPDPIETLLHKEEVIVAHDQLSA